MMKHKTISPRQILKLIRTQFFKIFLKISNRLKGRIITAISPMKALLKIKKIIILIQDNLYTLNKILKVKMIKKYKKLF
jgi:hypothetical protein